MHLLPIGVAEKRLVMLVAAPALLAAMVALWLGVSGSPPDMARDFEDCAVLAQTGASSSDERSALMTNCGARFAGRRKAGGGYTYYDFMQDRNFDIAGPNPSPEEQKRIDREYMGFLDAQRREAISAELAKRQNEQLRAEIEGAWQSVGPPLVLTPKTLSSAAAKRPIDRSKTARCEDGSLSCSWEKLSAVVKNAFASSPKTKP